MASTFIPFVPRIFSHRYAFRPRPAVPSRPAPTLHQLAQVGDELVVLVLGIGRLDGPDQQLVEVGAGHPVQHDLFQADSLLAQKSW